jgi:hypothetical protein
VHLIHRISKAIRFARAWGCAAAKLFDDQEAGLDGLVGDAVCGSREHSSLIEFTGNVE